MTRNTSPSNVVAYSPRHDGHHGANRDASNVVDYVDLVMTVIMAQMEIPRRVIRNSVVQRELAPVTTTFGDSVLSGIITVGSRTEEQDTEAHRNDSNVAMV